MKWGHVIVAILDMLLVGWVMAHMNIESMVQLKRGHLSVKSGG